MKINDLIQIHKKKSNEQNGFAYSAISHCLYQFDFWV